MAAVDAEPVGRSAENAPVDLEEGRVAAGARGEGDEAACVSSSPRRSAAASGSSVSAWSRSGFGGFFGGGGFAGGGIVGRRTMLGCAALTGAASVGAGGAIRRSRSTACFASSTAR